MKRLTEHFQLEKPNSDMQTSAETAGPASPFVCFLFAATLLTVILVFTAQRFCVAKTPV